MHDDLTRRLRDEVDSEFGTRPSSDLSDVLRRGRRKRVRIRLMATVSMVLVGTAVVAGGLWIGQTISSPSEDGRGSIQPADDEESGRPEGIFADVGGWIAFGNRDGIWAVDPTRSGDPAGLVQLSSDPGYPQAWSSDGSKLLFLREVKSGGPFERDLFVLNSDGTETRLAPADNGGDFTPDGSQVVYGDGSNIYVIDADGGTPRLLRSPGLRPFPDSRCPQYEGCVGGNRPVPSSLYQPRLSPDGSQIAYFDGLEDSGHSLRVMNSDGTGTRVVLENDLTLGPGHVGGLDWSPDGQRLVFALDEHGVYVVGIDGQGLTQVSSERFEGFEGVDPHWSPDGALISFNTRHSSGKFDALVIAGWHGTPVQEFDHGRSGPWNPR